MTSAAPSEPAEPILRLRGVGRRFGGLFAVDGVNLDVVHGERRKGQ
jgi:ABC-type branched-subunit amino acid transport system ATPase component